MTKTTDHSSSPTSRDYESEINHAETHPSRPNNERLINEPREGASLRKKSTTSEYKFSRPGREFKKQKTLNNNIMTSYGDSIHHKQANACRIFFQNVKGLTYSASGDDYEYYLHNLKMLQVDVTGMAETNTPWQLVFHIWS